MKINASPAQVVFAVLSLVNVPDGAGPAETVIVTTLLSVVQATSSTVLIAKRLKAVVVNNGEEKL